MPVPNLLFVDPVNYNASPLPNRRDRSYRTIAAANAVAVAGDLILYADDAADTTSLKSGVRKAPVSELAIYDGMVIAKSAAAVSCAADTNENTLATVTVPGGLVPVDGSISIVTQWTTTNSGNNKTLTIKLGANSHMAVVATTAASARLERDIFNRDNATAVSQGAAASAVGVTSQATVAAALDWTAAQTLLITGTKASSGETLTLEYYEVRVSF
jgi:hypothetical protein